MCVTTVTASVSYPPPHDYNYSATILYNITSSINDSSYIIEPGFSFLMAGTSYTKCWFHSDGVLSFDAPDRRSYYSDYDEDENLKGPTEKIMLSWFALEGVSLVVKLTTDNFTIDYTAQRTYES